MRIGRLLLVLALCHVASAAQPTTDRMVELTITSDHGQPRPYVYVGPDFDHLNFKAMSDAAGKYPLKVPATQPHYVTNYKSGKCALFTVPPDVTQLQVKLTYGHVNLIGRVIDASGRGVEGAKVNLYAQRGDEEFFLTGDETDAGGYFDDWPPCGNGLALVARVMKDGKNIAATEPIALHDQQIALDLPPIKVPDGAVGKPADKDTRRPLSGIVQDEQGQPIAGVRVELGWYPKPRYHESALALTDAQGRWTRRIPITATGIKLDLNDGHHVATIFDRNAPSPPIEKMVDGSAVSVMKTGQTVHGVVRDEAGNPVGDALVLAASSGGDGATGEPDEDVAAHTAPDGSFQLQGIPTGPRQLSLFARDLAMGIVTVNVQEKTEPLKLTMSAGAKLVGEVVDSAGKSLADAEISVYTWTEENGDWHYLSNNTRADADGKFTLQHLPRGSFELRVEKKGYNANFQQDVRVQADPVRITLFKPATLAGKVLAEPDGKPVTAYKIVPGHSDEHGPIFNDDDDAFDVKSADGAFQHRVRWSGSTTQPIRVIADGFLVKDTTIDATDGAKPAEIRLTHAEPYAAVVHDPQGKPVPDARVAWIGPGRHAFVRDEKFDEDNYTYRAEIVVKTDAQGAFKLPRLDQQGSIFIAAPPGYALIARDAFVADKPITLTAWSTVKGAVLVEGKPAVQKYVKLYPPGDPYQLDAPVVWQLSAVTGPDGAFTVHGVPTTPLNISRSEIGVMSHERAIEPKPGETLEVTLGGGGQTIRGRIEAPPALETEHFNTTYGVGRHYTGVYARRADTPTPERSHDDLGFAATLHPDGQFVIDGVPPGKYELVARVHAPTMPQSCGIPIAIASAKVPFELADKPLELGTVALQSRELPVAGDPAPALEGKNLTGDPATLAELKGRVVLLDFWASWCAPCRAQTPRVKAVFDKYAKAGHLAVLGVDLDYKIEEATRYAEEEKLPWPSIIISGWGVDNRILQSFGVTAIPSFWLIDAQGNVIARDIPPDQLDAAVGKALR